MLCFSHCLKICFDGFPAMIVAKKKQKCMKSYLRLRYKIINRIYKEQSRRDTFKRLLKPLWSHISTFFKSLKNRYSSNNDLKWLYKSFNHFTEMIYMKNSLLPGDNRNKLLVSRVSSVNLIFITGIKSGHSTNKMLQSYAFQIKY